MTAATTFTTLQHLLLDNGWTPDPTRPDTLTHGVLRIYWGADQDGTYLGLEGDPGRTIELNTDGQQAVDLLVALDILPITAASAYRTGAMDAAGAVAAVYRGFVDEAAVEAGRRCYAAALNVADPQPAKPQAVTV